VVSSTQVNLSWIDHASNEDGFEIWRCRGSGCTRFARIATIGAKNATTYSDGTLRVNRSYSYEVRAFNTTGNSGFSNVATALTSGARKSNDTDSVSPGSTSTGADSRAGQ